MTLYRLYNLNCIKVNPLFCSVLHFECIELLIRNTYLCNYFPQLHVALDIYVLHYNDIACFTYCTQLLMIDIFSLYLLLYYGTPEAVLQHAFGIISLCCSYCFAIFVRRVYHIICTRVCLYLHSSIHQAGVTGSQCTVAYTRQV